MGSVSAGGSHEAWQGRNGSISGALIWKTTLGADIGEGLCVAERLYGPPPVGPLVVSSKKTF